MKWYEDPVYIKMCKKAPEIQELWKPAIGDWFYKEDGIGYGLWLVSDIQQDVLYCSGERMHEPPFGQGLVEFRDPEGYIWLIRQDQLQEMVAVKDSTYANIIPFADFAIRQGIRSRPPQFRSMEQLWLAFVMKEKYNKVWDGENWVKEGK